MKFADVFLLPSEQESFGLAALEAMAAETPIISSNAGGIPRGKYQGETGFLAEVGNVETMASYAIKLLSDDKLLAKLRKKQKSKSIGLIYWSIFFHLWKMYEETLENFIKWLNFFTQSRKGLFAKNTKTSFNKNK